MAKKSVVGALFFCRFGHKLSAYVCDRVLTLAYCLMMVNNEKNGGKDTLYYVRTGRRFHLVYMRRKKGEAISPYINNLSQY